MGDHDGLDEVITMPGMRTEAWLLRKLNFQPLTSLKNDRAGPASQEQNLSSENQSRSLS